MGDSGPRSAVSSSRRGFLIAAAGVAAISDPVLSAKPASAKESTSSLEPPSTAATAIVNIRTEFGAVGDGVADDTEALQRALSASTLQRPLALLLPPGSYRVTRELTMPFAPGTMLAGGGAEVTKILQATDGASILHFATTLSHSVTVRDLGLEYLHQQTRPSAAVLYGDASDRSGTWFRHVYEGVNVRGAYDAFALDAEAGAPTIWQSVWRDVNVYKTKHTAFRFAAHTANGQPTLLFDNVGIFNTGDGGLRTTGPAFDLQSAEVTIINLDLEGWHNEFLNMGAGAWANVLGLHVESHVFDRSNASLVSLTNTQLSMTGFGISGVATSGNTDALILFAIEDQAHAVLTNGTYAIDASDSSAYVREAFWNNDGRGPYSVVVNNLTGTGVHAPGTGPRADQTAAMMTGFGILPGGRRGFSAPAGGSLVLSSPNGSRYAISVDDDGSVRSARV